MSSGERVDMDVDGEGLDDLAISGDLVSMFRLERMNETWFWGAIYMKDGRSYRIGFSTTKGRLKATCELDRPSPKETGGG